MKYKYCTLFDRNYLPHVLSLYDSLEKNILDFVIYCFCMDDESFEYLERVKKDNLIPVSYKKLEEHYHELAIAKSNRSRVEYYFTCTSAICSYIFERYLQTGLITYLDADLYFFSSPEPIYLELKDASIGIIEHRFSFYGKKYQKYGRFNVGWISFRNDKSGRECLEDWRKDCLEYCYDRLEDGKFADQKYLDYWPTKYSGVKVIQHLGANLAPWNVGRYHLKIELSTKRIFVNHQLLIFYHFSGFKQVDVNEYITNVSKYFYKLTDLLKNSIYLHYLESIKKYNKELGITINYKNRSVSTSSGLRQMIKKYAIKVQRFICRDYINF